MEKQSPFRRSQQTCISRIWCTIAAIIMRMRITCMAVLIGPRKRVKFNIGAAVLISPPSESIHPQRAFKMDCTVCFRGVFLILLTDGIVIDCGGSDG